MACNESVRGATQFLQLHSSTMGCACLWPLNGARQPFGHRLILESPRVVKCSASRILVYTLRRPILISKCIFLDAGRGCNMYLGFSWWSREHDSFRACFKSMLSPNFPDHLWWPAIVNEAGGDIVGTVAGGTRGVIVEDIHNNRISTMDLISTSPSSTEMPLQGANCGKWISAMPHLIHRQDRSRSGQTVLHILCDGKHE